MSRERQASPAWLAHSALGHSRHTSGPMRTFLGTGDVGALLFMNSQGAGRDQGHRSIHLMTNINSHSRCVRQHFCYCSSTSYPVDRCGALN
jgi:hypothetical protein